MKKNPDDEFYSELDEKTQKKSCCTCQTMLLFFAILLVCSSILVYWGVSKIKEINLSYKVVVPSESARQSFAEKLNVVLQKNPALTLVVTAEELTTLASAGFSGTNFILKEIQFIIDPKQIEIFGTLTRPLGSNVKIITFPQVENAKVKMKVQSIDAGKLRLPAILYSEVEKVLNSFLDINLASFYEKYEVEEVFLEEDQMVIKGKLK